MKSDKASMRLYAVTDRKWLGTNKHDYAKLAGQIEVAIKSGVTFVQLREKELEDEAFVALAKAIQPVVKAHRIPFVINDRVDLAIQCQVDGVHIGQGDGAVVTVRKQIGDSMILGVSVETVEQALQAEQMGADYLGVGAMFPTDTKTDASAISHALLKEICQAVNIPVVAIGGIHKHNLLELSGSGVDGVAVISAIFAEKDIEKATLVLRELSDQMVHKTDMKKILTIAGSDCSGGAGIQADIKTIAAHKMYAMSAITALTAQNTQGVFGVVDVAPDFVALQLDCIFNDIMPDAVKIGMVSNIEIIKMIESKLIQYKAKSIVIDPVMVSTSGSKLLDDAAIEALIKHLLVRADLITPNIPEAECLCGFKIESKSDMMRAAEKIAQLGIKNTLIKGGHLEDCADDLFYAEGKIMWFNHPKIDNPNTHGTGCTLSSAIACHLAEGDGIEISIGKAKAYITGALKSGLDLGKGSGPLNHAWI